MNWPTLEEVAESRTRYRRHLLATQGPDQSVDAFAGSPYFICRPGERWDWNREWMRYDCVILAQNDVRENGGVERGREAKTKG